MLSSALVKDFAKGICEGYLLRAIEGGPGGGTFVVYSRIKTDPDGLTDDAVEKCLRSAGLQVSVV